MRLRVAGPARFKQLAELAEIARQGPVGFGGHTLFDEIEGSVQPDDHAVVGDHLEILVAQQRAAAEGDDLGLTGLHSAHACGEGGGLHLPEQVLAVGVENLADFRAGLGLDFVVKIEEAPAELVGQGPADSGLAASHEADKKNSRRSFELKNHICLTSLAFESDNSTMQPGLLPLFPLQVVLLPGAELPLHIFEDRYKEMIGEVLRDRLEFGVILASEKGIVNTGCTASIDKVLHQYPDGRMDILARGRRRFEIVMLNDERSYLRGTVEFFDDEDESAVPPETRQRAIEGYNEMQKLLSHDAFDPNEPGRIPLSFRLAQPVSDLAFRQVLLTTRSESDRLRQLADFFPVHNVRQKRIQHVKEVAPRNGHGRGASGIE